MPNQITHANEHKSKLFPSYKTCRHTSSRKYNINTTIRPNTLKKSYTITANLFVIFMLYSVVFFVGNMRRKTCHQLCGSCQTSISMYMYHVQLFFSQLKNEYYRNRPNIILQILPRIFHFSRFSPELPEIAKKTLKWYLFYKKALKKNLWTNSFTFQQTYVYTPHNYYIVYRFIIYPCTFKGYYYGAYI